MANSDVDMERFAYDVCVHVLEKFGIFKAPDDTRKENKYVRHDFLPRVSRSVLSFGIWFRDCFKNELEDNRKITTTSDEEMTWIFDEFLSQNYFLDRYWGECVCISLAVCTEYIQFANAQNFYVSLHKLVIGWSEYFEKQLRGHFEKADGFSKLYTYLEITQIDQLDNFQEAFISDYLLPYGAIKCTRKLAEECMVKHGFNFSLENTIFCLKPVYFLSADWFEKKEQMNVGSGTSDSEEDSSSSSTKNDLETSQNLGSEASDSEITENNLLGIPPHEETLRKIDPFFVKNILSPPKSQSSSKSSEHEPSCESHPPSFPVSVKFKERLEKILLNFENGMDDLRALMFENGLISEKSSGRATGLQVKAAKSPEDIN